VNFGAFRIIGVIMVIMVIRVIGVIRVISVIGIIRVILLIIWYVSLRTYVCMFRARMHVCIHIRTLTRIIRVIRVISVCMYVCRNLQLGCVCILQV